MAISTTSFEVPGAAELQLDDDTIHAELSDGRRIAVPLTWYPRLLHATPEEWGNWEIVTSESRLPAYGTSPDNCSYKAPASREVVPSKSTIKARLPCPGTVAY